MEIEFERVFEELTGNRPLSWQRRLYDHFVERDGKVLPSVIDLPTGLGKTMVMAIWLIARAENPLLPRRLVYVVDRRTVVDQATEIAEKKFLKNFIKAGLKGAVPAISTLRGQLADNREWSRDPSRPAIIIGTVDLIGSGLLFSGYRSGFKYRPHEAGMLGQDSLLVLDEAHLSKPFEKLVKAIEEDGAFQKDREGKLHGAPMKVIRMSATSDASSLEKPPFSLDIDPVSPTYDLKPDPDPSTGKEHNQIIPRFGATKRLKIEDSIEAKTLNDALAKAAIRLATDTACVGKRIVVFIRSPEDAKAIERLIKGHDQPGKSKSNPDPKGPYADSVEVLTGTMRGLERDELIIKPVFEDRWLNGNLEPSSELNQKPAFLISTSAGEVGFDLNGDHIVSDQTTIDSFIQRLGRVNRRGGGEASIVLIPEIIKRTDKDGKPRKLSDLERAILNTLDLLKDQADVSPRAIDSLKKGAWKESYADACSPPPTMVELTDILLDAWSMTSIFEPMPGRPPVAPWLRGIADEIPETTIAWRAELDLDGFDRLDMDDIEEWFDTHRVLAHETLSVPTTVAAKWMLDRWAKLSLDQAGSIGKKSIIIDRAGLELVEVKDVIDELRKNDDLIRNAELILPASFGGIERKIGLLDAGAPTQPQDKPNVSDEDRKTSAEERGKISDVADVHFVRRYRCIEIHNEDGAPAEKRVGPGEPPDEATKKNLARLRIVLESDDDRQSVLISYIPKPERLDWGTSKETLAGHVKKVQSAVERILSNLNISEAVKQAALLAAEFHDHGKNRRRWQNCVDGTETEGSTDWLSQLVLEGERKHQPLGKSGGRMKRDPRGYRHEFGSLREFIDAHKEVKFTDSTGKDITEEVIDLAMHLIAVHHGRGRPHFPKGGFDPDCESRSDEIHTESIRRFARVQRKYGRWHLAWLENLLRCADAMASSEQDSAGGAK